MYMRTLDRRTFMIGVLERKSILKKLEKGTTISQEHSMRSNQRNLDPKHFTFLRRKSNPIKRDQKASVSKMSL